MNTMTRKTAAVDTSLYHGQVVYNTDESDYYLSISMSLIIAELLFVSFPLTFYLFINQDNTYICERLRSVWTQSWTFISLFYTSSMLHLYIKNEGTP